MTRSCSGKRNRWLPWLLTIVWAVAYVFSLPGICMGLEPHEILIVANRKEGEGIELARYYAKQRNIPKANLMVLDLPVGERCTRDVYEKKIAGPIRKHLKNGRPDVTIRCLVLMYGLPLKVAAPQNEVAERFKALRGQVRELGKQSKKRDKNGRQKTSSNAAKELAETRNHLNQQSIAADQRVSVDSELMTAKAVGSPIPGWIENPFYLGFRKRPPAIARKDVLMVSRLDGPNAAIVKRIIDDALTAEKEGLSGKAYFDMRWPMSASPPKSGYQVYDRSLHRAVKQVEKSGRIPAIADTTSALFQPGQCPEAALYCGWYSLAKYVDAFEWQRGAVGYHIASSECATLKNPNSQVWCKRMIEDGVCATLGPVNEPYVKAFPMPEVFFEFLTEGILSLAECYMVSLPYLSWQMVLIGDPLYRPFDSARLE